LTKSCFDDKSATPAARCAPQTVSLEQGRRQAGCNARRLQKTRHEQEVERIEPSNSRFLMQDIPAKSHEPPGYSCVSARERVAPNEGASLRCHAGSDRVGQNQFYVYRAGQRVGFVKGGVCILYRQATEIIENTTTAIHMFLKCMCHCQNYKPYLLLNPNLCFARV